MNAAQKAGTGRKHPGPLDHSGHKQTEALSQQKTEMHRVLRHTSIFLYPGQASARVNGKTLRRTQRKGSTARLNDKPRQESTTGVNGRKKKSLRRPKIFFVFDTNILPKISVKIHLHG